MNKKEISKEVTAIRKLYQQATRLRAEAKKREGVMSNALAPFTRNQEVTWMEGSTIRRGRVMGVNEADIAEIPANDRLWSVTVYIYKRGTTTFSRGNHCSFVVDDKSQRQRAKTLKPYVPNPRDPAPREFTVHRVVGSGQIVDAAPGDIPLEGVEILQLVEKKPGYRLVKNKP